MRVPTMTDPNGALAIASDQYATGQPAPSFPSAPSFPFGDLIPDLQQLIKNQFIDMPTRWSLSWTCKQYRQAEAGNDFDRFAFADKCAKLGYLALLQYSVQRGGPCDDETLAVAARHGQVHILEAGISKESMRDRKFKQ